MIFKKIRNRKLYANDAVLKRVNGKPIRYVSDRDSDGIERILGRGGRIVVTDRTIEVNCGGTVVFSCLKKGAEISELISLGGVRITGTVDGERKSVTAFFTYFNQ